MSKKRARSKEKKAAKFKKIINEGRKLFLKYGSDGFSMRSIAQKVNMQHGNLYNYIQSKRELWFAVIQEDFEKFTTGISEIMEKQSESNIELLLKIAKFYVEFALEDYDRYKMMFLTPAPSSESIGPIEANYEPTSFDFMQQIVNRAIDSGELIMMDSLKFTMFIWGIMHGNMSLLQPETLFPKKYAEKLAYQKEYSDFLLKQIKEILQLYAFNK